ncbi:hypothetical protein G3480_03600 [Thiorhodococcus mannitoliphagus]|uniref:Uncharacterized protein n=1 Tax=Thiorhodococcus mannitoliphagus TaxID=329406 RepID=A0A6P1DMZ2_9GAMM|nr:hypothetical protein [Thiorhodococcus mannitoliphagus]NEX19408.1 hypothetical protein [Thiorhodococcus mannitoliphagus]
MSEIEHRLSLLKQTEMLQAELAARTLPDQIQSAYVWLSSSERQGELAHLADDIRANWQRLRRTLDQRKLI